MFYLILASVLFSVLLVVTLWWKPLPDRLGKIVYQLEREERLRYYRRQAEYFDSNTWN